jgi:hypothetical protein
MPRAHLAASRGGFVIISRPSTGTTLESPPKTIFGGIFVAKLLLLKDFNYKSFKLKDLA